MGNTVPSDVPIESFERFRVETYTNVIAATILVLEYAITFNSEVTLIWASRWNYMKFLFIVTRYLPLVDVPVVLYSQLKPFVTVEECKIGVYIIGWCTVSAIITAEIILVLRTWAIWKEGKRIGIVLVTVSVLCICPVLYIEPAYLKTVVFTPYPYQATPGCLISKGSPIIGIDIMIIIGFESFLLALTLVKAVKHYRIRHLSVTSRYIDVLYRDGIIFYVYLLGISLTNLIVAVISPNDPGHVLTTLQRVLHSTLSARVLINLREAHAASARESITIAAGSAQRTRLAFAGTQASSDVGQLNRGDVEDNYGPDTGPDQ